ncbi:MAG: hypothetical protein ABIQ65_17750 [Thermoanaerobaculia bacterium]
MPTKAVVLNPYFSDGFGIDPEVVGEYGAFNISLVTDLPLFIDPFLIFTSEEPAYQTLHREIVRYVTFLRDQATEREIDDGLTFAWMMFSEVKQTWLGFSAVGNRGAGLGRDFAGKLRDNLHSVFKNFGEEKISRGSHLEKLCLVREGVGRDKISDFTTNLIKRFLLEYTQTFAKEFLTADQRKIVNVPRVSFDYERGIWIAGKYELPWYDGDYVLLTPKDLLTRDETWINRSDLVKRIEEIVAAVPDQQLRATLNDYFRRSLPKKPKKGDREAAASDLIRAHPEIADYYIREQEDAGDAATSVAHDHVVASEHKYIDQVRAFSVSLASTTTFYEVGVDTLAEARLRVGYLKHVIEDQDGYRYFYDRDEPLRREKDLQILFKLTWFGTTSDVNAEVNNGRGPVDFKVSRGRADMSLVEFKLASNKQLKKNLENQVAVYEKANDTTKSLKAILFFTDSELAKVNRILKDLGLDADNTIILIDARPKPSGSVA